LQHVAVLVDDGHVAVDEADLRPRREHLDAAAQMGRRPDVVAVEDGDDVPAREGEGGVRRGDVAAVALPDDAHATGCGGVALGDGGRRVDRAVVDDDHVDAVGRVVPPDRALERVGHEALLVVRRHDGGDARLGGHPHVVGRRRYFRSRAVTGGPRGREGHHPPG
jgi:hypothetical protein